MAAGDVILFDQCLKDVGDEDHNFGSDTFKLGITDGTTTPAVDTADPRWGVGGTTDFSAEQVTPGGNYADGGPALTTTWQLVSGQARFDASDITISQAIGNPTNGRWGIVYNTANNLCVVAIDLGTTIDMSANDLAFAFSANGIFRFNQSGVTTADNVVNAGNNVINGVDNVVNTA